MKHQETSVAMITGGGQGLGRASALRMVREGVRVVISDLDGERLRETAALSGRPELVRTIVQDVTADSSPRDAVALALDEFGRLDWLVNNAGIGNAKALHDTSDEDWDRYMNINLRSVFRYSREAMPHLKPNRGAIVHISSIFGILGHPATAPYAASKAALIGFTRQMAADYGPQGVRVNAVAPGLIETPLTLERLKTNRRFEELMVDTTPFHRIGKPEDIANAVYFLCSDEAAFVSGHVLVVDGGWSVANYVPSRS